MTSKYILQYSDLEEKVSDIGFLRRIICVPFTDRLPIDGNSDIDLNDFFSWLCMGACNYYRQNGNIKIPESFINATIDMAKNQTD